MMKPPAGVPAPEDMAPSQDQSLYPGVVNGLGKLDQLSQLKQVGSATSALPL